MSEKDAPMPPQTSRQRIQPAKLMLSKWTAVSPQNREKHFLVTRVIVPEIPDAPIEWVDLEAVHSGRTQRLAWRDLTDPAHWIRGWR